MSEQSRVFIGLLRPPKLIGLPIMYAMVWLFGSTLLFLWVQSWVVAVGAGLAWPALWKAADWDPNFLDVLVTTLQETPPTANRKLHGATAMPRDGIADNVAEALDPLTALPTWVKGEKRLSSMLPYVSLVTDRTIWTRGNELMQCIRLEGVDSTTSEDAHLDRIGGHRRAGWYRVLLLPAQGFESGRCDLAAHLG